MLLSVALLSTLLGVISGNSLPPEEFTKPESNYYLSTSNEIEVSDMEASVTDFTDEDRDAIALDFLVRYNYTQESFFAGEGADKSDLIRQVQRKYGLAETGQMDDATTKEMLAPRCGFPDNYEFWDLITKFYNNKITYRFINYSPDLSVCEQRNAVKRAMRRWEEQVEIDFVEVGNDVSIDNVDMEIKFGWGYHGLPDECSTCKFRGQGGVLAHAFAANSGNGHLNGDVHFDEAEWWAVENQPSLITYNGNSNGAPCVLPFVYRGQQYYACTNEDSDIMWCATTSNFDRDRKYGLCPDERLFTYGGNSKGRACSFPFTYRSRIYHTCINDELGRGNGLPRTERYAWCATTDNFDRDRKFGFCPTRMDQRRLRFGHTSLYVVAAHEIGHALGLLHSTKQSALMYDKYQYLNLDKLPQDDIDGIQKLYGGPRRSSLLKLKQEKCGGLINGYDASSTIAIMTTTTPHHRAICRVDSIDAAMYDGTAIYLFKDKFYWILDKKRTELSGPDRISDLYPQGPGTVDAVYKRYKDGVTRVFSGKYYYEYGGKQVLGPLLTRNLGLHEDHIKGVFNWRWDRYLGRYTYFFGKDRMYRFYEPLSRVSRGYPISVEMWDDVLVDIDAALAHTQRQRKTWFFKSGRVYLYDDQERRVVDTNSLWTWLKCDT